jgi:hypothetical protein
LCGSRVDGSMPDGIVFALGALVCAALNDIVFKKAVGAGISVGWFASMIGTTWGLVQVCGCAKARLAPPVAFAASALAATALAATALAATAIAATAITAASTSSHAAAAQYAPWSRGR